MHTPTKIKKSVWVRIARFALFGKGIFGRIAYKKYPMELLKSLSKGNLTVTSKILDVGCGSGSLLYTLSLCGLKNCMGVDKYVEKDIVYANGLKIKKGEIKDVDGKWDIILFNHSFEHISDQFETIRSASRLLSKDGVCIISLPIVSSYAWEKYQTNWFNLDAPRHFFLHSVKSLQLVAKEANLVLRNVVYNSTGLSLIRSEQYALGIPLHSQSLSSFSKKYIKLYESKARELNLKNQGDTAIFYFIKQAEVAY